MTLKQQLIEAIQTIEEDNKIKYPIDDGETLFYLIQDINNNLEESLSFEVSFLHGLEDNFFLQVEYWSEMIQKAIILDSYDTPNITTEKELIDWLLDLEKQTQEFKNKTDIKTVILYDLEALEDDFITQNKKDFEYHFNLLKGNLKDLL